MNVGTGVVDKTAPILRMSGIRKEFPGVLALDGVDFDLLAGEVHVLLGENGAGKSTLMKILSGALLKDDGDIYLDDRLVEIRTPRQALELGIRTIYQEFNLVPHLSVSENIFLGKEPQTWRGWLDRRSQDRQASEILHRLGLELDVGTQVADLSVAEQQMVEVARALSADARILVMDEPTSALTEAEINRLFETIQRLKFRGVGIIYISHRLQEISEIGDRVTVLRDGRYITTEAVGSVGIPDLIRWMADRELNEHFPRQPAEVGRTLLEVRNLTSGDTLRGVSFALREGEVVGLAGLMGAGRTALARVLFGLDRFQTGEIRVKGSSVRIRNPAAAIRLGIGYLTEDRKNEGLVLSMTVLENVSLPSLGRLSTMGVVDRQTEKGLVRRFAESLRIKMAGLEQRVSNLSGGNQQKVVLSKWLAREADILVFDEPTRGIDVGAKVEIYQLMNELTARGAGILMISSEMPEILGMSDRILVMRTGRLVAEFDRREASQEKVLGAALGYHRNPGTETRHFV